MKKMIALVNRYNARGNYLEIAEDIVAVELEVDNIEKCFVSKQTNRKPEWGGIAETEANFPLEKSGLEEKINALTGHEVTAEEMGVMVITNSSGYYGASAIFYDGVLEALKDYYLVPSSVHEWLAVPKSIADKEYLAQTIRLINRTEVSPKEVLSDFPYVPVFKNGKWTIEKA